MTLLQVILNSGLKITSAQRFSLGRIVGKKASEMKIERKFVKEYVNVNDYPDDFIPEIEKIIIDFVSKKK